MKTSRSLALLAAALASLAAGCGAPPENDPAPLDRFTYPVGVAVAPGGDLLVVSSNFDLSFSEGTGGSVLRVDAATTPATFRAGVRFPSYAGEIALADAAACGLPAPEAIVVSRASGDLHRLRIEGDGGLTCGEGCRVPLGMDAEVAVDPYGVAVVCTPAHARAYVGFLRTASAFGFGEVAQIDLATGEAVSRTVPVGVPRSFAYDAENARLYFTGRGVVPQAPLRWFELGGGCTLDADAVEGGCPLAVRDLSVLVRGADLQDLALSNPQPGLVRRAYVAARLYDADLAVLLGGRPTFDVGGVLLVLDLVERGGGDVDVTLVRQVPIGRGAAEVAVLPARTPVGGVPRRDLVAVTATEEGVLWLYDDELGAVAKFFSADPVTGHPLAGRKPFAVAATDAGGGDALVYVSSFDEAFVTAFRVPLDDPGAADAEPPGPETRRIGAEAP